MTCYVTWQSALGHKATGAGCQKRQVFREVLGCILTVGGRLPKKAGFREVLGCILTVGGRLPKKAGFREVLGCILTVQANSPLLPVQAGDSARHRGRGGTILYPQAGFGWYR